MANKKPQAPYLSKSSSEQPNWQAGDDFIASLTTEKAPENQGMASTLRDQALSFGTGVVGGVKMLSDLAGPDNAVSKTLGEANTSMQGMFSAGRAEEMKNRQALIDAADNGDSTLDQITTRLGGIAEAPIQTVMQAVGSMAPNIAAAQATGGVSAGPGLVALAARFGVPAVPGLVALAARFGVPAALGIGMGVGSVKGQNYEAVFNKAKQEGLSDDEAVSLGIKASEYSAQNAPQQALGGAFGMLDSLTGAERMITGMTRKAGAEVAAKPAQGLMKRTLLGAAEEAPAEGLQGAQGQYAQNEALNNAGFTTNPWAGVAGAGINDAVVGAMVGGPMGALHNPARQAPVITPQQAEADAIRATELVPEAGAMTRAANVGTEAKARAVESAPPITPEDMFAQELAATKDDIRRSNTLQKIRDSTSPTLGITTDEFLAALGVAGDVSARMDLRRLALEKIQGTVEHFKTGANTVPDAHQATEGDLGLQSAIGESRTLTNDDSMPVAAPPEREAAPQLQAGDIQNKLGKPFTNLFAAKNVSREAGPGYAPVKLGENAFVVRKVDTEINQAPALAAPTPAATETVATAQVEQTPDVQDVQPAPPAAAPAAKPTDHIGRDNKPLAEGGKPFKTRDEAAAARQMQPMMRVVKSPTGKGFSLAPKTEAQLAAQDKAAKRLSLARTGKAGVPTAAHEFIAGEGGMDSSTRTEFSFGSNPRVGNRTLFAGARGGMSIEAATEKLIEARYLPQGASHSDTVALINRSFTQPQYTVDGTETVAQAEVDARFDDYLAAEQDAAQHDDFDPFESAADLNFTIDDAEMAGYDAAEDPIKLEVNALLAQAGALGIETSDITEQAYEDTRNGSEQDYYDAARAALAAAIETSTGNSRQDAGAQGNAGSEEVKQNSKANESNAKVAPSLPGIYKLEDGQYARFQDGIWFRRMGTPREALKTEFPSYNTMAPKDRGDGDGWTPHSGFTLDAYGATKSLKPFSKSELATLDAGDSAGLTAPTRAEVLAQQERTDNASKAKESADRAADKAAAADEDRKRIAKASEAAADTFVLGGNALDNLTGQGSMFDMAAEPEAHAEPTEVTHNGTRIYQAKIKLADDAQPSIRWAVESQENKVLQAEGNRAIGGDSLHSTLAEAKKAADFEATQYKQDQERKAKIDAEAKADQEAAQAKKDANKGKSLSEIKAEQFLAQEIRNSADGVVTTRAQWVKNRLAEGKTTSTQMVDKIKPLSRAAFNRANNQEQAAHDKKVKDGGKVPEYMIGDTVVTKTEYDYAQSLSAVSKPAPQAEPAPTWHTKLPDTGVAFKLGDEKLDGSRSVISRMAQEAADAITQVQGMNGAKMYAYVLPSTATEHGALRLLPEDQTPPAPWVSASGEGLRTGFMTGEQLTSKLREILQSQPILTSGDEKAMAAALTNPPKAKKAKPATPAAPGKEPEFSLDPLDWDAKKLSAAYSMEQLNTLYEEVKSQFSNETVGGSPVDGAGMATKDRLNEAGLKMEAALKKAIGIVYEKSKQAKPADQATAILDAANVTGKERIEAMKDIKKGDITPDELKAAYPANESDGKAAESKPSTEATKPPKIEDSGQVLEGARKLYAKNYAAKLAEGEGMDTAAVPLSKSWPEPDYQRLIDEGADPWAVAMTRAMRDEVPTKPSSWKLKGWVQKVESLRSMTADVMSGEMTQEKFKTTGGQFNLADWFNKIDLYEAVGHSKSLKTLKFSMGEYGMYGGQTFKPAKKLWTINMPGAASTSTWASGNWGTDLVVADTKADAIEKFKAWSEAQGEKVPTEAKATSFDIYSYRSKPGITIVGKRINSTKSIDLKEFTSVKEAREYKAGNQTELEALLAKAKFEPSERGESNAPRVGADHRSGADVTSEQFRETFGFRGEQFGASMPQSERQANMNQAYDALMDLAGVVGIPPKALSLNGELGLAFGARGTGGKNPAAAHYERDTTGAVTPNRVVINLTRKNGAGSLAHEWFHAVDNYFARMRGEKAGMLTESHASRGEGVRPEMVAAFKQLMMAIQSSGVRERSKQLDKKRVKDYWSTGLEMAARSFESYVIAKLQDNNGSNDYLANIVPESLYTMQGSYPYPIMGEMPAIRAAFDNFFGAIQTKETEQGMAMFSRSGSGKSDVLSKDGKFKGWPKFNAWTRQEYGDVVSLLPDAYRNDAHRREPVAAKDWDALAAAVLPELEAINNAAGEGAFRLDPLGNIIGDVRRYDSSVFASELVDIANRHDLGIFLTGLRTSSMASLGEMGFTPEMGLGAILARATGSTAPVMPMASGTVNNTAYGTMMSYKPRGFAAPMFSKAEGGASQQPTRGTPVPRVQAVVDAITANWANAPEVVVVSDMQDERVPQKVREADQLQKSQGAQGEPDGFIYKGVVYLVAAELPTINDAVRVLLHESLGHAGLRGVFGDALAPILNQVAAFRRADIVAKAREYGLLNPATPRDASVNEQWQAMTERNRKEAAEEVLAVMAQTHPELGFVKRAVAAIRNWLRANVPGFKSLAMTDADIIQAFILPARRHIEGKQASQPVTSTSLEAIAQRESNLLDLIACLG